MDTARDLPRERPRASLSALILVLCAASYTAALCLINTHVVVISNTVVALVDGAIVIAALVLALRKSSRFAWIVLLALAVNFLFLGLFSEKFDLKVARDPLVLIAFSWLGFRYGDARRAQLALIVVSALVLGFGVMEYLAPELFLSIFNIRDFYAARGVLDSGALRHFDSTFFASGARPDERIILPFLGPHRVSSIFLEPVSMGNFGAIALAFALSLGRTRWRMAAFAAATGVLCIVFADARFAFLVGMLFLLARIVPTRWTTLVLAPMPGVAIVLLIAFALSGVGAGDDLPTRLASSGRVLLSLSPASLFGLAGQPSAVVDSGYAYAFSAFGLPLCVALWAGFLSMPAPTPEAARYKLLLGVYICALLCISGSSLFALKTAALTWFIAGALSAPYLQRVVVMAKTPSYAQGAAA